jgi:hypothetical protein
VSPQQDGAPLAVEEALAGMQFSIDLHTDGCSILLRQVEECLETDLDLALFDLTEAIGAARADADRPLREALTLLEQVTGYMPDGWYTKAHALLYPTPHPCERSDCWQSDPRPSAFVAPPTPALPSESAWLIERGQSMQHVPTVWWTGRQPSDGDEWTTNAFAARRFSDREAAQREIDSRSRSGFGARGYLFGIAVEHGFIGAPAPTAGEAE